MKALSILAHNVIVCGHEARVIGLQNARSECNKAHLDREGANPRKTGADVSSALRASPSH